MAVDIFDPRTLLGAVRQMTRPRTFLRDTFFGRVFQADTEHIDFDLVTGKRRLAPFVSPKVGGKVISREGYTVSTFVPPLVAPRTITTAEDVMKRRAGEMIYNGMSPEERQAEIIAMDMVELEDMITRREEWMCAQALFAGAIDIVGEGVNRQISFGFTNSVDVSEEEPWSATTTDPVAHLEDWREDILEASGVTPNIAVMSLDVFQVFRAHDNVQKLLDTTKIRLGTINPQNLPNGAIYQGMVNGTDIYTYSEWYLDDATGLSTPMVPKQTLLFGSTNAGFVMGYGAYHDVARNVTAAAPRYPRSWVDEGANQRYLEMDSRPLPIPTQVNTWIVAKVLADAEEEEEEEEE